MANEEIQYQVNSAVNVAQGRIENGATVEQAFAWLQEELDRIFTGEILYEHQ